MSRKDIILVAVLVNVGLLILMFAGALKSGSDTKIAATVNVESQPLDLTAKEEVKTDIAVEASIAPALEKPQEVTAEVAKVKKVDLSESVKTASLEDNQVVSSFEKTTSQEVENPKEEVAFIEIKVKRGDILEKIARAHSTTVNAIMKANNLNSTRLNIGQVLQIPTGKGLDIKKVTNEPINTAAKYYVVKAGDSLWTIANKNHVKVDQLLKLNHLTTEKSKRLKPGDKLRIS